MKKIIIFVLVIVFIGTGIYFFVRSERKSNPGLSESVLVNNWKTYSDKDYGFEIKIPENWSGGDSINKKGQTVYKFEDNNIYPSAVGITVPIDPNSKPNTSAVPKNEILNGYSVTHYVVDANSTEIYVMNNNNQGLWIALFFTPETKEIVNQIVSTFKYK